MERSDRHMVFTYGILRGSPDASPAFIYGDLYDIGHFPGAVRINEPLWGMVYGELIEVDDRTLAEFDRIEGIHGESPLYRRIETDAVLCDGTGRTVRCYVYEFARPTTGYRLILSGHYPMPISFSSAGGTDND